jgi:2-dehydropantoate 2-reductase
MKRVCIVGAGAIGGLIGARLAHAGRAEVCALARGDTLAALREHGWRLDAADGESIRAPARAASDAAALGEQDLVVIAVKSQVLPALAPALAPLIGAHTVVLPAMNGVPWWFCRSVAGFEGQRLDSVDPGGAIEQAIAFEHVVGCVVHAAASTVAPGHVQHRMGRGLIVGEPGGGTSDRVAAVAALLSHAGFEATASDDVRTAIWYKLWGNLTMNPVSAITGATADRVLADPLVRAFCTAAMSEASLVGARIACPIAQSPADRHLVTAKLGAFKTSMLQDVEAGRPIELDAIVTVVHEIAGRLSIATPNIDALLGLARLFARSRGLYPEASPNRAGA